MKFFRKSLFWVIALVVLGGAFFLVDERVDVADRAREANLRLFSFQPEDVSEFWIRNTATGLFARVVRDGDEESIVAVVKLGEEEEQVIFWLGFPSFLFWTCSAWSGIDITASHCALRHQRVPLRMSGPSGMFETK